ncbi:MAG: hypothetical protein ACI9T7_000940 [Oleiphilaceae bacterium]|jgi:hypothetical protein
MILRLQLLVIFTFSFFLLACTEDRDLETDNKTVDIRLDNAEAITLEVIQSTFLTHLYLPIFEFLGEADLPDGAVKVENITLPDLQDLQDFLVDGILDCQDFPAVIDDDSDTAFYCFDSPNDAGGVALYSFPTEQKYVKGDKIEVRYEDFENELGWVNNGQLQATYLKTDGLNRDFVKADTISCLVNLQSDLTDKTKIDETKLLTQLLNIQDEALEVGDVLINDVPLSTALPARDSNMLVTDIRLNSKELNSLFSYFGLDGIDLNGVGVIDAVGDGVRFISVADAIKVEVYGKIQVINEDGSPALENGNPIFEIIRDDLGVPILDSNGEEVFVEDILESYVFDTDEKVIVINHSSETTDNQIASIKMDQVYSVSNLEVEEVSCQSFEREISASLTNFSVHKDNTTYEINGSLRMLEGTEDYIGFSREVRNSSFTTTVTQEKSTRNYTMSDFSISYVQNAEFGNYSFDSSLNGSISSSAFPGVLGLFQGQAIVGADGNDRPASGQFTIFGQGFELIFATFKDFSVLLAVDYNGDSTGNNRSDVDFRFEPNWDDLISRDFIQPEEP